MSVDDLQKPHEVLIEGRLYDITGFRHPGGSVLKFFKGTGDATEAFVEFHYRSKHARKMLANLPNRANPVAAKPSKDQVRLDKLSANYLAFRKQLVREGWFKPDLLHVMYRILEIIFMFTTGLLGLFYYGNVFTLVPLCAWLGIAVGRCGWLMHEGGHISLTGHTKLDIKLQELIYGLGCAMSGGWWRSQHNKHHCTPQKLKHDVDLDTLPLIAFNKIIAGKGKKSAFMRFWLPLQGYLFGPLTCLIVALGWQLYLHPRFIMRTNRYFEGVCIASRYAFVAALSYAAGLSVAQAVGTYLLVHAFGSSYIFVNFALSHTHLDVLDADKHVHWAQYGSDYTVDITPHLFTDWWMGYLNYQIEHHLFPTMPQYKFVKLNSRVRTFFEENVLKYDCRGYFECLHQTFANLHEVGQSVSH